MSVYAFQTVSSPNPTVDIAPSNTLPPVEITPPPDRSPPVDTTPSPDTPSPDTPSPDTPSSDTSSLIETTPPPNTLIYPPPLTNLSTISLPLETLMETPPPPLATTTGSESSSTTPSTSTFIEPSSTSSTNLTTVHGSATSRSVTPGVFIVGVLGGLVVLVLVFGLGIRYIRRRRARRVYMPANFSSVNDKGSWSFSFSKKINRIRYSFTPDPLPFNQEYLPPEGKRARLYCVHREMEEAQRLRENFQLDLERSGSGINYDDGMESPGVDIGRLGRQIDEMSGMIATLQLELQRLAEERPPPDYSSTPR